VADLLGQSKPKFRLITGEGRKCRGSGELSIKSWPGVEVQRRLFGTSPPTTSGQRFEIDPRGLRVTWGGVDVARIAVLVGLPYQLPVREWRDRVR
jgi:hypothetical protein